MVSLSKNALNIRGVSHYYEWVGGGYDSCKPVMVFIHGWAGSARYWQRTATALSAQFNCLLYDLRGFGRSKLPETPVHLSYELEEYAEDLALLLDGLGLESVYINSHSMGASIAVFFLTKYGERVKKAILTCSGIFEYNALAFAAFYQFGGYVVKFRYPWFLKVPGSDRAFMARFLYRPIPAPERRAFLVDFLEADYEAALGTIYTSVSKKAVEIMPQEFATIGVPTLLISGEKDQIIPATMGKQAASLNPRIQYIEMSKTGHFPMLEDEETYLRVVREFLNQD
jgi:pimeloyl-ACP methyl ester carboxylesterase